MKMIQGALVASIVLAFSGAALAQSKAVQMTDAQMASVVAAGGNGAEVYKPENTTTFIWNNGRASRVNDRGQALTTVNSCGGQFILC